MKTRFLNQGRPPVAGRPGWLGFCRPGRCLPAFLLVTLATCLAPTARSEPPAAALDERAEPPVARSAPFTPKVFSLLAVLSLDEKLSPKRHFVPLACNSTRSALRDRPG